MEDLASAPWLRRLLVAALLAGLIVLAFEVLKPFIVPVIWAVILAHVTWPLHRRLLVLLKGRRAASALVMTVVVTLAIVLPAIWLVALIRTELVAAYAAFTAQLARGIELPRFVFELPWVGPWLDELLARIAHEPGALNAELRGWIQRSAGELSGVIGGVGRNIAKLFIAMLSVFFMYRDGESFAAQVVRVLENSLGERVHGYMSAISQTVRAVVYGLLAAAIAQGTIAGLGYWVAGLKAPIALGALTMIAALIPFMTPVVWVGASIWLVITGHTVAGTGLFLWGLLAISWIDNIVRPLVISNATSIPFLLVLFGVLGGVVAFGLVGLFVGPVILAVLMAVWREWMAEKAAGA
ncbi:MAG TPA: AI-2E family transporter [Steroidobacteraceae bacterium]|nr:AI-2E family transporter [Steroidobacteraceae bacterium]HQZ79522.1 AI-2E family transporter [Steroidobacteraceae bacterium]